MDSARSAAPVTALFLFLFPVPFCSIFCAGVALQVSYTDCCDAHYNRWRFTQGFATFTAVVFSVIYTALAFTMMVKTDSQFAFSDMFTLDGVKKALATDEVVLPAWLHYVAFDLFTAKWQVRTRAFWALMLPWLVVTGCHSAALVPKTGAGLHFAQHPPPAAGAVSGADIRDGAGGAGSVLPCAHHCLHCQKQGQVNRGEEGLSRLLGRQQGCCQ